MGLRPVQIRSALVQAHTNCTRRYQSQAAQEDCKAGVDLVEGALRARSPSLAGLRRQLGQIESMSAAGGLALFPLLVAGVIGVVASGLGSLLVRTLIPAPVPGDGFTVRWIDDKNVQNSLGFGAAFRSAFEYAQGLVGRYPVVEVVEVRQGNIVAITRVGQKTMFA